MDFLLHNGFRSTHTKQLRTRNGTVSKGRTQFVMGAGKRLILGRPARITEEELAAHLQELTLLEWQGRIFITDMERNRVSLRDGSVFKVPAVNDKPNTKFETASDGLPINMLPPLAGREEAPPAEFDMPVDAPEAAYDSDVELALNEDTSKVLSDLAMPTKPVVPPPQVSPQQQPTQNQQRGQKKR